MWCVYAPKPGPVLTYPGWDCRLPSVLRWGLNEGHPPAACTVCSWRLSPLQNCHPAAHSHAHWPCTSSATLLGQYYRPQPWLVHTSVKGWQIWILTILCMNHDSLRTFNEFPDFSNNFYKLKLKLTQHQKPDLLQPYLPMPFSFCSQSTSWSPEKLFLYNVSPLLWLPITLPCLKSSTRSANSSLSQLKSVRGRNMPSHTCTNTQKYTCSHPYVWKNMCSYTVQHVCKKHEVAGGKGSTCIKLGHSFSLSSMAELHSSERRAEATYLLLIVYLRTVRNMFSVHKNIKENHI